MIERPQRSVHEMLPESQVRRCACVSNHPTSCLRGWKQGGLCRKQAMLLPCQLGPVYAVGC